nr:carboxylesterase COEC5 [Dendroctonus valens]
MSGPTVAVKQGTILGTTGVNLDGDEFYKFLGIPYAKPPIGPLRFKAPEPCEPWAGTRNCTQDGSTCLNMDPFTKKPIGTEDCLFLNVHTRSLPKPQVPLNPVMVFIHGGAFTLGSGTQQMCDPKFLLTKDIVLVSMNYRLGVFGFLSLEDDTLEVPGNAGLKDQTMALRWVQENIARFNGDPGNVTIFGVSAGGASVQFQIVSPTAKGLFHKAIAQSGSVLNPWAWGQRNAVQLAEKLGKKVASEKEALTLLRGLSDIQLYETSLLLADDFMNMAIRRPFGPIIEKPNPTAFLCEDPALLLATGRYNQVPQILGACSNEGLIYEFSTFFRMSVDFQPEKQIIPWNVKLAGESKSLWQKTLSQLYYKDGVQKLGLFEQIGDVGFYVGVMESTKLALKNAKQPIYLYMFSYQADMVKKLYKLMRLPESTAGVAHGMDSSFLFPNRWIPGVDLEVNEEDVKGIQSVVEIWTNFAHTGNPHKQWEPVTDPENLKYLDIDKESQMRNQLLKERLDVWANLIQNTGFELTALDSPAK